MAPDEARLQVEVVYGPAGAPADLVALSLPVGACLHDALVASGLCQRHGLVVETLKTGIWGRLMPLEATLRDRDRVELYRPLLVDPKEARRLRYKRTRKAAAG